MEDMTASPGRRRVLLAAPRGYCAGVDRAVIAVEKALEQYGAPIYVRHEIVHNKYVVQTLEKKGAIFVEQTEEVPEGNIVMFSAHGVAPTVHDEAARGKLATIDATCPLVTKVHKEAIRYAGEDFDILLIGHEGHEEVIGTSGEAPDHIQLVDGPEDVAKVEVRDPSKIVWLSQTTLSVDETMETVGALKEKFPLLVSPPSDDICYATQNRQLAVKQMGAEAELVIVVGSRNSSNSVRLVEVAKLAYPARPTSWTSRARSTRPGWRAWRPSASPRAPPCRRSSSKRSWNGSPGAASRTSNWSRPPRSRSPSPCPRNSAATCARRPRPWSPSAPARAPDRLNTRVRPRNVKVPGPYAFRDVRIPAPGGGRTPRQRDGLSHDVT